MNQASPCSAQAGTAGETEIPPGDPAASSAATAPCRASQPQSRQPRAPALAPPGAGLKL